MEKYLAYFEANPEEFADLSESDRMSLMAGESIEGEISGESPAAEDQQSADEKPAATEGEQVVLAKDGKHTIPFAELQQAREQARHWQALAEESARQRDSQAVSPAAAVDLKDLRRQLREATLLEDEDAAATLEEAIDAEILRRAEEAAYRRLELQNAEAARIAEQRSVQEVADKLVAEHPYLDHQGSAPNWEAIAQVQALRDLYVTNGKPVVQALADAVAKVTAMYSPQAASSSQNPDDIVARKAAEAIASAKLRPPTSMSSIPSSDTPPTDELQAVAQLGRQALQDKLMDMPRERILELLNRQM